MKPLGLGSAKGMCKAVKQNIQLTSCQWLARKIIRIARRSADSSVAH